MTNLNSIKEYTWDTQSSATTFAVPPYLQGRGSSDITVKVNGIVKVSGTDFTLDTTSLRFDLGYLPTAGQKIQIERNSSQDTRLTGDDTQLFFMAQEALDDANVVEGNVNFYSSSATPPTSPNEGDLWYDTSLSINVLKVYNGTTWESPSPIRSVTSYANTDFTAYADSVNDFIVTTAYNSSTLVFLNGVRLIKGTALTGNATDASVALSNGDYYYDETSGRLILAHLTSNDVVTLETVSGALQVGLDQAKADVQTLYDDLYKLAYNPTDTAFRITGAAFDTFSVLHYWVKVQATNSAAQSANNNAQSAQSGAETARDLAQEYATTAEDTNVTGTSEFSAKHYAAKAAADAAAAASTSSTFSSQFDATWQAAIANYATQALGYKDAALIAKTQAEQAKASAEVAEHNAELSETAALAYKNTAGVFKDQALGYRDDAVTHRNSANTHRIDAVAAKNLAETAQTRAETAETNCNGKLSQLNSAYSSHRIALTTHKDSLIASLDTKKGEVDAAVTSGVSSVNNAKTSGQDSLNSITNSAITQMTSTSNSVTSSVNAKKVEYQNLVDTTINDIQQERDTVALRIQPVIEEIVTQANIDVGNIRTEVTKFSNHPANQHFYEGDGSTPLYSALHYAEECKTLANTDLNKISGWVDLGSETVSTYGNSAPLIASSTSFEITAPQGVKFNGVPTPVMGGKIVLQASPTWTGSPEISVSRVTSGKYRFTFSNTALLNATYNAVSEYSVSVTANEHGISDIKVTKGTDYFDIECYTNAVAQDQGELVVLVYEFT